MAYRVDLSTYDYVGHHDGSLNVGWLADQAFPDYPRGEVPEEFTARLRALVQEPMNLCRGAHVCWCGVGQGRNEYFNGEIRVQGENGKVYAAPVGIAHYVEVHNYQPPQEFVDAVLKLASLEQET